MSERYRINPKTVAKWRKRTRLEDCPMGPRAPHSTVLSADEETLIVAFRRHTLLPLDDCLHALQATVPHLTRSSLHRLFERHDVSRLPQGEGPRPRQEFKAYPLGYIHIDFAEVWTDEGKLYLFVAIDRVTKLAFAVLHERATRRTAADCLCQHPIYATHDSLRTHLATFLDAYNFAKRLKSLRGLTPWIRPESCRKAFWRDAPAERLLTLPPYAA